MLANQRDIDQALMTYFEAQKRHFTKKINCLFYKMVYPFYFVTWPYWCQLDLDSNANNLQPSNFSDRLLILEFILEKTAKLVFWLIFMF